MVLKRFRMWRDARHWAAHPNDRGANIMIFQFYR